MPQGRFLAYADALDRNERKQQLYLASFLGMAVAGGDSRAWDEAWESTLTDAEREALYRQGGEELARRATVRAKAGRGRRRSR